MANRTIVKMSTNYGDMTIELYDDLAPITVENFLGYVEDDFYEDVIVHRLVTEDFYIAQAGIYDEDLYDFITADDFDADDIDMTDPNFYHKPGAPIELETDAAIKHVRGTIAMARTSSQDSATAQFFLNIEDNPQWNPSSSNPGYAVFGMVVDGLEVLDLMKDAELLNDDEVNEVQGGLLKSIPAEPIKINSVEVVRAFGDDSDDFSEVPFAKAANQTVRRYVGGGQYDGLVYQQSFTDITYLGVNALQWTQEADSSSEIDDFTIIMATDADGMQWVLYYIINEDTVDEQVIVDATNLLEAVTFEQLAEQYMIFKLMAGDYNINDVNNLSNSISIGSGQQMVTSQIVAFGATAPGYDDADLVKVKWYRGPFGAETDIDWYYYSPGKGLYFHVLDDADDPAGDSWRQAREFDQDSDNFENVNFIGVPSDQTITRTFVGNGNKDGVLYYQKFTYPTTELSGVRYMKWEQQAQSIIDKPTLAAAGIYPFTLHLARDKEGNIWVLRYEYNDKLLVDAETILDAVAFSTIADDHILFKLIAGDVNADDVNDASNTLVVGSGDDAVTSKIISFTETIDFVPHYDGELIAVKVWTGATENADNINYYHHRVGLVLNQRDGQTVYNANGWRLAFWGGYFESDSADFSQWPYLAAGNGDVKTYLGQGKYEGYEFTDTFNEITFSSVRWLKWVRTAVSVPNEATEDEDDTVLVVPSFNLYIAKDSLGAIWVYRYKLGSNYEFPRPGTPSDIYEVKLLSELDDDVIYKASDRFHFKLIAGDYAADDLTAAINKFQTGEGDELFVKEFDSFTEQWLWQPIFNESIVRVKTSTDVDPDTRNQWQYFHADVGLMLELWDTTLLDTEDDNYFDPSDADMVANNNLDGWRLAYYGKVLPVFSGNSSDFSEVDFIKAKPGTLRFYRGQGGYAGTSFRFICSQETIAGVNCLRYEETAVPEYGKKNFAAWLAKDTAGKLWVFKVEFDGLAAFQVDNSDQAVAFDLYPAIYQRILAGGFEVGDEVVTGQGDDLVSERIFAVDAELADWPDEDNEASGDADELTLVRYSETDSHTNMQWTYYDDNYGKVLDLWDNFFDPEDADPNVDDPTKILVDGDGWLLAEPAVLAGLYIKANPGRSRESSTDSLTVVGPIEATPLDVLDSTYFMSIGPWQFTIDTSSEDFKKSSTKNRYSYKTKLDDGSYISLHLDLDKKIFAVTGKKLDLTGLAEPVPVTIAVGNYYAQGAAERKGSKKTSLKFCQGYADKLLKLSSYHVYNGGAADNKLKVKGQITSSLGTIDLTDKKVTVKYGTTTETIPAENFKRSGKSDKYTYRSSGTVRSIIIDWGRSAFSLYMKKSALAKPVQDLTITIVNDDDETLFEQTVEIN
ncbi:MAG: peptidylprolyl isomerase [Phycisphaerae bacterium]|nr:peptidylprolyl isomerase [Phycisphaerae bacterium]